jgi:hypothetical protein
MAATVRSLTSRERFDGKTADSIVRRVYGRTAYLKKERSTIRFQVMKDDHRVGASHVLDSVVITGDRDDGPFDWLEFLDNV